MVQSKSKLLIAILLAIFVRAPLAQLTIGAASELKPTLEEIRRLYTERTGNPVRTTYAPPTTLLDRASKGGIDCIIGPSESIELARAHGLSDQSGIFLGTSPIIAWSRQGKALPDSQLSFLLDSAIHGIVVSDPAQSPDGARVHPFLEELGADSAYRSRWRIAPDPLAAIDTIMADRADAAILPQSAFWSSAAAGIGRQLMLDSVRIAPQHTFGLVLKGPAERQANAAEFLEWLRSPQCKGIWRRKGYIIP